MSESRSFDDGKKLQCAMQAISAHVAGTDAIIKWYRDWLPDSWVLNHDGKGEEFRAQMALSCFLMEHAKKLLESES